MNITIVGVGALGSHVLLFARNVKGRFTVIDMDRVEQKNLMSQAHTKMTVGRNKAQAVSQSMQGLYGLKVKPVPHRLTSDNVEALLGGSDLVVDCLDNGESRRVIQKYVRANDIACLHGALSADGAFGRVVWDALFKIDDENVAGEPTCEGGEHLPFITMAASCMATQVRDFVNDGAQRNFNIHPGGLVPF
jgi:molybdopterin/thiamine biosynthesis adenylyltransferase